MKTIQSSHGVEHESVLIELADGNIVEVWSDGNVEMFNPDLTERLADVELYQAK